MILFYCSATHFINWKIADSFFIIEMYCLNENSFENPVKFAVKRYQQYAIITS